MFVNMRRNIYRTAARVYHRSIELVLYTKYKTVRLYSTVRENACINLQSTEYFETLPIKALKR